MLLRILYMQKKNDLDAQIHRAFVELGWIFPVTSQEVEWAEKAMEGMDVELPENLKEPPWHLLEQLEKQ
jgi:hypothetical protein